MNKNQLILLFGCISTLVFCASGIPSSTTTTPCKKGYKYTAPINADGRTDVFCDAGSSCHTIMTEIVANNAFAGTTTTTEMTIGQCVMTSACDQVTCGQVKRFLPSNLSGMMGRCTAKCCKQGVCHNLSGNARLQLPRPSPVSTKQHSLFEDNSDDSNLASTNVCKKGVKYGAPINADGQNDGFCDADSSCHVVTAELVYRNDILGTTTHTPMEVGQCVDTRACAIATCANARRLLPSNLIGYFGSCTAKCCKNGVCHELSDSAGRLRLPGSFSTVSPVTIAPSQFPLLDHHSIQNAVFEDNDDTEEETTCGLPARLDGLSRQTNYQAQTRGGRKQPPKFYLMLKNLNSRNGYKASKSYKLSVRAHNKRIKIRSLFISLLTNTSDCSCMSGNSGPGASCPVGRLLPKVRRGMVSNLPDGCIQPLSMIFTKKPVKQAFALWKAPNCKDVSITIKVLVRGSNGRLYEDDESLDEQFQYLKKVVRPRLSRRS